MTDNTYNGWTNWETWNVALWCDNEEVIYRAKWRSKPDTAVAVAFFVRDWFPDGTPDMDSTDSATLYGAKSNSGYPAVNWDEIADNWREEFESED